MRITLTGRRLALAAVLVLAGALAPLAYSALGKSGSDAARPLASPVGAASVAAAQAPGDVGANPGQIIITQSTTSSGGCWGPFGTPIGTTWVLDAVTVITSAGALSNVEVSPVIKDASGNPLQDGGGLSIPLDSTGDGSARYSMVLKWNTLANAALFEAYNLFICWNNASPGSTVTYAFIITGQIVTGPTQAVVADFTARPRAQGALLHWKTASETQILGFNVWRYRNGKGVKVNRALIRAKRSGKPSGASYRYVDSVRGAKRGLSYRLQLVDLKGKRTWYAAFAIASK